MLNLLSKLRPALSGEGAPAVIADLAARREAAKARVDKAHDAFEEAVQRAAAGQGTWDEVASARTALLDARASLRLLTKATELAENHHAAAAKAATVDQAWQATLAAAKRRDGIADRLQKQLTDLATTYAELTKASREVHHSLPGGFPFHAAASFGVEPDLAPNLMRIEYSRRGLPGGPNLSGFEMQLLADRYKDATRSIELARAASREAAANG